MIALLATMVKSSTWTSLWRNLHREYLTAVTIVLSILVLNLQRINGETKFGEAIVEGEKILTLGKSPYLVTEDVLVRPNAELKIEAGVEIRFMPEVGITVRGILTAQGTPTKKIKFVPAEDIFEKQPNRTIRLVDGPNVNEGIIQVLDFGSWRSVCTNSRNWTAADMSVACKQLGFQGGEWHHWYPHLNDTRQLLYQDPGRQYN